MRVHDRSDRLFGAVELVDQDRAVVSDHLTAHAPVVILMTDGAAAAREVSLFREHGLVVPILVGLTAHDASARCHLSAEAAARGSHCRLLRRFGLVLFAYATARATRRKGR